VHGYRTSSQANILPNGSIEMLSIAENYQGHLLIFYTEEAQLDQNGTLDKGNFFLR
jgi:hypothetical protein